MEPTGSQPTSEQAPANGASRDPDETLAELAFRLEQRIKETAKFIRTAWVRLAEDLFKFNDLEYWRMLGHESFDSWLAGPEMGLERRWVYQLMKNWRELVVLQGVQPEELKTLEPSKVAVVLPAIRRNHVTVDEALEDVRSLSRGDLRERYGAQPADDDDPGGARPDTSTRYDAESEPQYLRCPTCGSRVTEEALR